MLEGNLYRLVSLEGADGAWAGSVELIPESVIYAAHFKGMPITPGVCLVQIAVELASAASGQHLRLVAAKDIKFLNPVLPDKTSILDVSLKQVSEDGVWQAVLSDAGITCAKMTLTLKQ